MDRPQIVIDTNVILAGLWSQLGASYQLLQRMDEGDFDFHLSVPLVMEYEDVCLRHQKELGLSRKDISMVIDQICASGQKHEIFYLWRPWLKDPKDDMLLELGVAANCSKIVTFNLRDFSGIDSFGIEAIRPGDFLRELGETE